MIAILTHLAWWIALLALLSPVPSFIANVRYGWWGYQMMRRQSPLRREMAYYNQLLTTDTYNKEVKLFTLGGFFLRLYRERAQQFYEQAKSIIVPRYLASFAWGALSLLADGAVYLYIALQAVAGAINIAGAHLLHARPRSPSAAASRGCSTASPPPTRTTSSSIRSSTSSPTSRSSSARQRVSPPKALASPSSSVTSRSAIPARRAASIKARRCATSVSRIHEGEAVALVGRNGAGKTTIVKLLTRLYDADEGQILINGRDIRDYDLEALRQKIGVIFQDYVTYYLSAGRNIGIGKIDAIDDAEGVRTAAAKSGANAVIERLPAGYESMLGKWFEKGEQLSGGEWQKIALARAFMRDAQLLILDEPTSSLDPQAEYEVFAHFRELTAGQVRDLHLAPLQHRASRQPHHCPRRRRRPRRGHPRRTARQGWPLRRTLHPPGRSVSVTQVKRCVASVSPARTPPARQRRPGVW